jgi:hypothetical protein
MSHRLKRYHPTTAADRLDVTPPSRSGRGILPSSLGPYSRVIDRGAVGSGIDGRSREGRFLRHYEESLIAHAGGTPTVTMRLLAARAARLALHLELMDERLFAGKQITSHDSRTYLAWSNSLSRILKELGLQAPPARPVDPMQAIRDHLAAKQEAA